MVLYEQVQEQEEKQAGAEVCQAQPKLYLVKFFCGLTDKP